MNGMAVRGRSAGDPPRPRCVGENDPADAAGSAGVPGIRIDFRSGLKLQDYPVLRLSFVRILAGCVCDATLRRTRHTESAGRGPLDAIIIVYRIRTYTYVIPDYTTTGVWRVRPRCGGARVSPRLRRYRADEGGGERHTTRRMGGR